MQIGVSTFYPDPPSGGGFAGPASVPGLIGYFSTDEASGYTMATGTEASSFNDRIGTVGNMVAPSAARRPTLVPNAFGSFPGLRFIDTGSTSDSDYLEAANDVTTSEETIFMVINVPTTMTGQFDFYIANNATSASYGIRRTDTGFTEFSVTGFTQGSSALRGAPGFTTGQPIILSGRRSAVQNAIALFENGSELASNTHTSGTRGGKFRLGLSSGTTYGDFTIGALLIYNRFLTETERLNVDEWLAARFSVYTPFAGIRTLYPTSRRNAARTNRTSLSSLPLKMMLGLGGQSNAEGGAPNLGMLAVLMNPIPGGYIWNPTTKAFEQLNLMNNLSGIITQHGPEMALMYDFGADFPGALLVKRALGNTSMVERWNKNGDLYGEWIARIKEAMDAEGLANGTRFQWAGIAFLQGEFDSDNQTFADAYETNLREMILDFRSKVWGAATAPWSVMKVKHLNPPNPGAYATVRAAQDAVAASLPNVFISGPWLNSRGDNVHADANSIRIVANQMALQFGATTQVA